MKFYIFRSIAGISLLSAMMFAGNLRAQTLGGASVYNFLHLPASPSLTAAGGVNVSLENADAGLAVNNPALLQPSLHSQLALNFNAYFTATKAWQLAGVFHSKKWNTTFGASIFYVDYGKLAQGDIYGNELGSFHPRDFSFGLSASRNYGPRIRYGITAKIIRSNYGSYGSTGLAFDAGLHYSDTATGFTAGMLAKNMGGQVSSYGGPAEDLPFDLELGITKRLIKAPFGFSLTLQQLHRFNTLYTDSVYDSESDYTTKKGFVTKVFNHMVLATHLYLGRNFDATIGYNFLRRNELNIGPNGNGLNGFSAGFRAKFNRLQFQYARAYYGRGAAYNQFGLQLPLVRKI